MKKISLLLLASLIAFCSFSAKASDVSTTPVVAKHHKKHHVVRAHKKHHRKHKKS